jgi:hypothetical protein
LAWCSFGVYSRRTPLLNAEAAVMAAGGWLQDQSAAVFMVAVSLRQRSTGMADLALVVSDYRQYDPFHR